MTQRIIICILFLVIVSSGNYRAGAGQQADRKSTEMHISQNQPAAAHSSNAHTQKMPGSATASGQHHEGHGKAARVPHMEELPHIHKYHKGRVKKVRVHHRRIWILAKALVVVCHLTLLWIAYLHLTH